jgi:glycogen debranching enzyme
LPKLESTATLVEEAPETPFYIPGTGSTTRPRRTLKHGDCFAVLDSHADIGATPGGPDGIFFKDTRYLSHLEMLLNGQQPLLLGSNVRDDNSILTVDLTNPDITHDDKLVLAKDMLHVVRTFFLWRGTAYQRLRMKNHDEQPFQVRLTFDFGSDFADLFEVRGLRRARRGAASAETHDGCRVALNYQGLDGSRRRTTLHFDPLPTRLSHRNAAYEFELQPDESRSVYVAVQCDRDAEDGQPLPFRKGCARRSRSRRPLVTARRRSSVPTTSSTRWYAARWPILRC